MDQSYVTVTLPMSEHGLAVILTALGIGVATWIVWLILSEQGRAPRGSPANLLGAFAVIMAPVWLVIFAGTLWQVWQLLSGAPSALGSGPSLGMGALLAALRGAPFVVWGTVLKQRTVDFQKEGHITDRITAAVEQLGAEKTVKKIVEGATQETSEPNIEVRIGAILSLERIAQDSTRYDKGRDHVRAMEILCAYVRENTNTPHLEPETDEDGPFVPRTDIQIGIDVIKRRSIEQIEIEADQRYRLDLRGCDLRGLDLSQGSFRGTIFAQCRFDFANMRNSDFSGARFDGSILNYLDCLGAKFIGADMRRCRIDKPEPLAGGFVTTITMGDVTGLSLISANVPSIQYFGVETGLTFGTKDTILNWALEEYRKEGAGTMERLSRARKGTGPAEAVELQERISNNPFINWSKYDGSDMATGHLLQRFRTSLSLTGWPYDN